MTPNVKTLESGEKTYKRQWFEEHYVAAPKMNDLCKYLLRDHPINIATEISSLKKHENGWQLIGKSDQIYGTFDHIICTAPAPQSYNLMPENFSGRENIRNVKMVGTHSFMLGFEKAPPLNFDVAKVKNNIIEWVFVNSSKPSRDTDFSLVIKSLPEWAEKHIDDDLDVTENQLSDAVYNLLKIDTSQAKHKALHRWRYAHTEKPLDVDYLWDDNLKIGICGDWCRGTLVEDAFLSAYALAKHLTKA